MNELITDNRYYDLFSRDYVYPKSKGEYQWLAPGVECLGSEKITTEEYLCPGNPVEGVEFVTLPYESMLCFEFADMKPTQENFKQFADKWGLLINEETLRPRLLNAIIGSGYAPYAQGLSTIVELHFYLRFCIILWRLLDSGNLERLHDVFDWTEQRGISGDMRIILKVTFRDSIEFGKMAYKKGRKPKRILLDDLEDDFKNGDRRKYDVVWGEREEKIYIEKGFGYPRILFEPGNIKEAAWYVIGSMIDNHLTRFTESGAMIPVNLDGVRLSARPKNLIGVLWQRFALVASRERILKRCEICGKWDAPENLSGARYHRKCYSTMKTRQYREAAAARSKTK